MEKKEPEHGVFIRFRRAREEPRQNERSSSLSRSVNLAARKFDQATRRFKLVPEASTHAGSGGPEGGKNLNKYCSGQLIVILPLIFFPNSSSLVFIEILRPRSISVRFLAKAAPPALPRSILRVPSLSIDHSHQLTVVFNLGSPPSSKVRSPEKKGFPWCWARFGRSRSESEVCRGWW